MIFATGGSIRPAEARDQGTLGESRVHVIDRDAAVLTGIIHSTNVDANGKPTTGHEAWSIVVQRIGGDWKVVQAHESYPRTP